MTRQLRHGGIVADHPGQLADLTRISDGRPDSPTPFVENQRYMPMHDGTPAEAVPVGEVVASDYDIEPLNSPRNLERMRLREAGRVRGEAPAPTFEEEDEADEPVGMPVGNFVHMDDGVANLDGQLVPLNDIEVARIQGIVVRAYQRKLGEELKRVKESYAMQTRKRPKKLAVSKRRRTRKNNVQQTLEGASGLSAPETSED